MSPRPTIVTLWSLSDLPPFSPFLPISLVPQEWHNDAEFIRQLRRAIQPHARYTTPWMTHEAVEERVEAWLQTNWTEKAVEKGWEWREEGDGYWHVVL